MPTYVSKNGLWEPALEKVNLTKKNGEPFLYEGKDRASLDAIANGDITSQHFSKDPDFINRVRQVHNMSMKEYMEANGFDEKTSLIEFEKKMSIVNFHVKPERKPAKKQRSGGANTAPGGGGSLEGDFGDLQDAKAKIK